MATPNSAIYRVYENQRFFPIIGWSRKLLPTDRSQYSNVDGSKSLRMEEFVLPNGWKWCDWCNTFAERIYQDFGMDRRGESANRH